MPRRGMAMTWPAPPLECTANGLTGPSPLIPVPCRSEIFSSIVISFTTIAARSSGERLKFSHGLDVVLAETWVCADAGRRAHQITMLIRKDAFRRVEV